MIFIRYLKRRLRSLHTIFLLVLFLYVLNSNAQQVTSNNINIDSLSISYEKGMRYLRSDPEKAELEFKNLLQLAIDKNNFFWQGKSLFQLSKVSRLKGGEDNFKEAILYGKLALSNFKKSGDSLEVFNCLVNISGVYITHQRAEEALQSALKGEKMISFLNDKLPVNDRGKFYGNLGLIYNELDLPEKSMQYNYKALEYFKEAKNENAQYKIFNNMGKLYSRIKKFEKSLEYFELSYIGFKKLESTRNLIMTATNLGSVAIKIDSLDLAKGYLREAITAGKNYKYPNATVSANLFMGRAFYKEHVLDSAQYYLDRTLRIADSIGRLDRKIDAFILKQKIAEERGDFQEAHTYTKKINKLSISIDSLNNKNKAVRILLDTQKETENSKKTKLFYILTSIVLLFLSFIYILYRKKQNRLVKSNNHLQCEVKSTTEEKDKLYRRMVSLTALNASTQKSFEQINHILDDIKSKISDTSTSISVDVQNAKNIIKDQIKLDKQWDAFFLHFEEVHPSFLKFLNKKYNLSATDLKVCACMKINLSNYEISEILGINQNSVYVITHRLKKKLQLPDNTTINQFLSSI